MKLDPMNPSSNLMKKNMLFIDFPAGKPFRGGGQPGNDSHKNYRLLPESLRKRWHRRTCAWERERVLTALSCRLWSSASCYRVWKRKLAGGPDVIPWRKRIKSLEGFWDFTTGLLTPVNRFPLQWLATVLHPVVTFPIPAYCAPGSSQNMHLIQLTKSSKKKEKAGEDVEWELGSRRTRPAV